MVPLVEVWATHPGNARAGPHYSLPFKDREKLDISPWVYPGDSYSHE
jgi:hypothetical protein